MADITPKYYLNEEGVGTLLSEIANKIKDHTSEEIIIQNNQNSEKEVSNPHNFTTTQAVVEYLVNRAKISINQQTTTSNAEDLENADDEEYYLVKDNTYEYNGEDGVQINLKLASEAEIKSLFEE